MNLQSAKDLVWNLWPDPDRVAPMAPALGRLSFAEDALFFGPAPIGMLKGRDDLVYRVYEPLVRVFPAARRRPYLFLSGVFQGNIWVAATGDVSGVMAADWLGIPATHRPVRLRFGEFYRVEDGRIVELRCLFDVLGLAAQAGYPLLPPFHQQTVIPPGPVAQNGLCRSLQAENETTTTLNLVEAMVGGCNRLDDQGLSSMGQDAFWHEDMVWHGPWGIGTCEGFHDSQGYAQGPSIASFPDRRGGNHQARIAEGVTAAFTGWPSLVGTFNGAPFHGLKPTGQRIGMNLMDFYVRRGDRLHENWVLIDLVDFWAQCGVDLLAGLRADRPA